MILPLKPLLFAVIAAAAFAQKPVNYLADQYDPSSPAYKALQLEQARDAWLEQKAKIPAYTKHFDLTGLPHYQPREPIAGKIRIWGEQYLGRSNLGAYWSEGFRRYHPGATFEFYTPVAGIGWPGLYLGLADLAMATAPKFYELQAYERAMTYHPTQIVACTGSFDVSGWTTSYVIFVNAANPLSQINFRQLDGVFGSQREGGWEGTAWFPERARGPEGDIRTWDQLGLTGEWRGKPIHPYGFSVRYDAAMGFSNRVLGGSDKWNGDLRAFGNLRKPDGTFYIEAEQIMDHLVRDRYGIAWSLYRGPRAGLKVLSVSKGDRGPYVPLTIDTVQNRSYPLFNEEYLFVNLKPGARLEPKVREFLRYVLSQEGQSAVERDGKYLPLTAQVVSDQLAKIR